MKNLILLIAVFTFSIPGNAFTNFNTTTESKPIKTLTEELRPLISIFSSLLLAPTVKSFRLYLFFHLRILANLWIDRRISENDCDNRPGVCKFKININFRNATAQINEFGELVLVIDANKFSKQDVSRYLSGSHFF